jgi:hypothetical protein
VERMPKGHFKKVSVSVTTAFIVAGIVGFLLFVLEKKRVIENRRDWAPLATLSSGIGILALGWIKNEKGMIASGSILATMSAVGLAKKQREARASKLGPHLIPGSDTNFKKKQSKIMK